MINHNLAGKALLHCLKVPGSKLLLVDNDPELRARIEDERSQIEGELGAKIQIMDQDTMREVHSHSSKRPEDSYRDGVKGNWPMAMFFTRFVPCVSAELM